MILEIDRLTLRPLHSTDVEAVASYSMKPEFIRFLPLPPQTMESAAQFVEQAVANGRRRGSWSCCRGFSPILKTVLRSSEDFCEGVEAFGAKRKPSCRGR